MAGDCIAHNYRTGLAWPDFFAYGLSITPTGRAGSVYEALNPKLADFPNFIASGALSTAKSPDGKTLLVLVSGHNSLSDKNGNTIAADSNEYVFVFDISDGKPVQNRLFRSRTLSSASSLILAGKNSTSVVASTITSTSTPARAILGPRKERLSPLTTRVSRMP